MKHAGTCSVKSDKLNKTHCKGISCWLFSWSLQLFPLFILPECAVWGQASKSGGIKHSPPASQWGMVTWTGTALGSRAPFAYRGSTRFLERRHLCASIHGEDLRCLGRLVTDALRYSVTYVVKNTCSILQQLVGKGVHMFKHFGGFKLLANVLALWMLALTRRAAGHIYSATACWAKFPLASKKTQREDELW